ncbi:MAG: radical SAM protein [DPANN group archaeon]|nr:radical SAM protein [DPANN group archaeon]
MVKIVFINPPRNKRKNDFIEEFKRVPLGICQLASSTRKAGIETSIIDAQNLYLTIDETIKRIKELNSDFVAISIISDFLQNSEILAERIRHFNPKIKIIVGGPHVSAVPESTMKDCEFFDIAVLGESDKHILEIINNKELSKIGGIIFRENNKLIKTKQENTRIKNLDTVPFPSFDLLEGFPDLYEPTPSMFKDAPSINLLTARGCLWNCSFCHQSVFGNELSYNSPKYMVPLMNFLKTKYKVKDICFYDDVFTIPRKRTEKFCEELIRKKVNMSWSCQTRIDTLDYKLARLMKKVGCWQISFGIESGSDKILEILNKKITRQQIIRQVKEIKKSGIRVRAFFIIGSPGETTETINETKTLIKKTKPDDILLDFFTPMRSVKLEKEAEKFGKIKSYTNKTFQVNFIPKDLTEKKLKKEFKRIQLGFYLQPRILLYYLGLLLNPRKAKYLAKGLLTYLMIAFK